MSPRVRPPDLNTLRWVRPFVVASILMPRPLQHALGVPVAALLLLLLGRAREGVLANLRRILGPARATPARRIFLAWKTFYQYGLYLLDYAAVAFGPARRARALIGRTLGRERLEAALARGRGAVLVTPHLGNWELGGAALSLDGLAPTVLEATGGDAGLRGVRARFRRRLGIEARAVGDPSAGGAFSLLEAAGVLRRGGLVAVLADRPSGPSDVEVEFFGGPRPFPSGPAALAHATGAPILPVFVLLGRDGRYDLEIDAPIVVRQGEDTLAAGASRAERSAAIRAATQAIARAFERRVAAAPDQWYNFFAYFDGAPAPESERSVRGEEAEGRWTGTGGSSGGSTRGLDAAASATPA
jgi:KDO2-lipid IV(A) lauroyltransferase